MCNTIKLSLLEKRERSRKNFKEIMAKIFPKLMKDIKPLIHGDLQTPGRLSIKKSTSWYIMVTRIKTKIKG